MGCELSQVMLRLLWPSFNLMSISQRDNYVRLLMIGILRLQAITHLKSSLGVNRGLARQASLLSSVKSISYLPYLSFELSYGLRVEMDQLSACFELFELLQHCLLKRWSSLRWLRVGMLVGLLGTIGRKIERKIRPIS